MVTLFLAPANVLRAPDVTISNRQDIPDIALPRLYERDIDVLVREELLFSQPVQALFFQKLNLSLGQRVVECNLSVFDSNTGETDIEARVVDGDAESVILIENKIDAAFQPRQPERYRARAQALAKKMNGRAYSVLIAPASYDASSANNSFDAVINYEDIAQAILQEGTSRSRDRAKLVQHAISLARRRYVQVPSTEVTAVWTRIYEIACAQFPELRIQKPGEKGRGSMWLMFKADLPPNISIDWKITKAVVDLSFWPSAVHRPIDGLDLSDLGASASQSGNTVLIRIPVSNPPTNWSELSDNQIQEALTAACTLLNFYKTNPSSFA